jgi:hypothetical protein
MIVVAFGPAIDRPGSATGGFGAMSWVVVLSIADKSIAESSAHRVSSACCYGQIFWEYRAEMTVKN